MAHTKAGGSTKLGRDSQSKRLGVKRYGGQTVSAGSIIVRQRGTKMHSGTGTALGADDTIYATRAGQVAFKTERRGTFTGRRQRRTIVTIQD